MSRRPNTSQPAQPTAPAVPVDVTAAEKQLVRTALRGLFTAARGDSTTVGALNAAIHSTNPGVLSAAEVDVVLEGLAETILT